MWQLPPLKKRCLDHSQQHLQRVSHLLAESQALGKNGGRELDLASGQLFWTTETYRIYEIDPSNYEPSIETALQFCSPDGRRQMHASIAATVARGNAFSIDIDLMTARQRRRWVRVTGAAVFDDGVAVRVLGAIQDITSQRKVDEELRQAKDAAEEDPPATPQSNGGVERFNGFLKRQL